MATSGLRPLSVGEILDAGIKVVTRHWKPLLICTLGLVAPVAVVLVLVLASIDPELLELVPEDPTPGDELELPSSATLVGIGFIGVMAIVALIVAYGACFKAVCDAWLGGRPQAGASIRYGLRRSGRVFLLSVIWVAFLMVAWIPCGIPLIWLGVAWSLSMPVLLFEDAGPFKALGRSYGLIKGRWWASLLIVFVCYLLVTIVGLVVQLPLLIVTEVFAGESAFANAAAQVVGYSLSYGVSIPYFTAVLTILYFDQRVRHEAFDLQLLADNLGTQLEPGVTLGPPLVPEDSYTAEQRAAAPYWPPPPGWVPPPPAELWSSPSGWTAPTPEAPPPGESAASPPDGDDRPWSYPVRPDSAADEPPPSYPSRPSWADPPPDEDDEPKRKDWQPPESPRGPGGL